MDRRYPSKSEANDNPVINTGESMDEMIKKIEDIPLPNQREGSAHDYSKLPRKGLKLPFSSIFKKIGFEEILLLGLIILLINEGIEDDFLLIILIYIFLSGFEFFPG